MRYRSFSHIHTTYTLITAGTNDVYMRLASQNWAEGAQGTMKKILSAFIEGILWSDTVRQMHFDVHKIPEIHDHVGNPPSGLVSSKEVSTFVKLRG